jgi:hypothetical protein
MDALSESAAPPPGVLEQKSRRKSHKEKLSRKTGFLRRMPEMAVSEKAAMYIYILNI